MSSIDFQLAIKTINKKKIDPLYFLLGEESYFSNRCIKSLRQTAILGELGELNEDVFYAGDVNLEKVVEALQSPPLFSDTRLVILKEAHLLTDKEWLQLDEIYSHFFQTSQDSKIPDCIFVIQASQVDRRKKIIKKWLEIATVIECQTPQDGTRAPWIRYLANEKGLVLDQEALAYMVQMGPQNLEGIDRDLEKIYLYFGGPHSVTTVDLANVLQRNREENIFSLSESIGKKDRTQALYLFHRLISQGESEIALVALAARHLRILLKLLWGQERGDKGASLASKAGINHYFLSNYLQQSRLWTRNELSQSLVFLANLDRQLKSSSFLGDFWFDYFLIRLDKK